MAEEKKKKEGIDKNRLATLILVAGVFFALGVVANSFGFLNKDRKNQVKLEDAGTQAKDFIVNNLVPPGTEIKVKGVSEEKGLYKVIIEFQGQEINSYLSKDGKLFFPQAMNIEEFGNQTEEDAPQAQNQEVPKNSKPVIETFIMSYCPYGTQIQKGLLPVANLLKDKIDFDFKFVDYAMHEKKEIDENILQYCMNKNNKDEYHKYLGCFLKDGNSETCLGESSFNKNQLDNCIALTDAEYEITKLYNDKESWNGNFPPFNVQKDDNDKYGIQGSPTMIINGVEVSSARDSQSLLETICGAFEETPEECEIELPSAAPTPGFGEGTASGSTGAECGE